MSDTLDAATLRAVRDECMDKRWFTIGMLDWIEARLAEAAAPRQQGESCENDSNSGRAGGDTAGISASTHSGTAGTVPAGSTTTHSDAAAPRPVAEQWLCALGAGYCSHRECQPPPPPAEALEDIEQRLLAWSHDERLGDGMLLRKAAAEIAALRAQVAALEQGRSAVRQFLSLDRAISVVTNFPAHGQHKDKP